MGPGRGILSLMEPLRFGKTEYELIWSRLDPFQPQVVNLVKLISKFFSFLAPVGPLDCPGALWLGQPRPGLALGWTLGAPKSVFKQPSITFRTFGTRCGIYRIYRIYRNGVKNAGRSPPSTRAGGQDDGSYTNSRKSFLIDLF